MFVNVNQQVLKESHKEILYKYIAIFIPFTVHIYANAFYIS